MTKMLTKEEQEFNDSIDKFLLSDLVSLELPFIGIIEMDQKLDNYGFVSNDTLNIESASNGDNNYSHYTFGEWKLLRISDFMNGKMYLDKQDD